MLGYLCAYYRYYHPIEFITSFLNNAANEDDIRNGTAYANKVGIQVTMPKWGMSRSEYAFDEDRNIIAKGLSSVKYMSSSIADELYSIAHEKEYKCFIDVLYTIDETTLNTRQLGILINLDFFSDFGNQRELLRISEIFYDTFKKGNAKQINKGKIAGTPLEAIVSKYAVGVTKSGTDAKSYTLLDVRSILYEAEESIFSLNLPDLDDVTKVRNFAEATGYAAYVSGKAEDRPKLYVSRVWPLYRKKDKKKFGYSIDTKSIGSGIESSFTILSAVFDKEPIKEGDVIYCKSWIRDGKYFKMTAYQKLS